MPNAAPRPCPTCRLEVGLADTNSTWIFLPENSLLVPKSPIWLMMVSSTAKRAESSRKKLIKPAPAISTFFMLGLSGSNATICWASSRGLVLAIFEATIAKLLAKSPWAWSLVRWITLLFCQSWGRIFCACSCSTT